MNEIPFIAAIVIFVVAIALLYLCFGCCCVITDATHFSLALLRILYPNDILKLRVISTGENVLLYNNIKIKKTKMKETTLQLYIIFVYALSSAIFSALSMLEINDGCPFDACLNEQTNWMCVESDGNQDFKCQDHFIKFISNIKNEQTVHFHTMKFYTKNVICTRLNHNFSTVAALTYAIYKIYFVALAFFHNAYLTISHVSILALSVL